MNREVWAHIFKMYGKNPWLWVGMVAVTAKVLILRVYVSILMAQIATSVAAGDTEAAKLYIAYFFVANLTGYVIGSAGLLLLVNAEQAQYYKLATSFYKKLAHKDLAFYRDNQTGYLASVFRQYLDSAILLVRFCHGEALATFISITIPPIVLFIVAPKVGLAAVAVVIVQFLYISWASSKAHQYRHMTNEIYRKVTGEISDIITNIVAFKSAGVEEQSQNKMEDLLRQEGAAFRLRRRATELLDLPRGIVTGVGIAAALYLIVSNVSGMDPVSIGLVVLTITYMFQIMRNVSGLPHLIADHDDLVTKIYPTLEYLNNDSEKILDPVDPKRLTLKGASVDIENISFSYVSRAHSKKVCVFQNLTINIKGGEQVGIVGLSGAGKSTLASLLLRFDDVDSGAIKIDGIGIREVKQSDLRRAIAYVPQEPLLFHRTIRENIAYYDDAKSDEDIIAAAKAAHAHEFIEKLPHGYDTMVGERGIKLSGGQKQRIAIARAILKKAPIMIFDEATSALDSESEQIIHQALPEILGKQTAIVIAHRLSTVAGLDRIIVMHDGEIEESGTHEELLAQKGRYYSLWQKQTREFGKV